MGITQLLPLLENSTRSCHISELRGRTVAVDTYCWLHKGARGCALQLVKGEETDQYVTYCLKYVKMLLSCDIKPILVFDGRSLPAKQKTEGKRREHKKQAKKQGMEHLRLGQQVEAYKFFSQCIDVTHKMALNVIQECRKIGVDCIVAPYEADAQLAFFNIRGVVDCVITEDSDLLLFGCQKVLYKMDQSGTGQLVEGNKLNLSMKVRRDNFTFEKFRHMCILSGCDYLESLPGIGIKKALKFITLTAETNPLIFLDKIPRYLKMKQLTVSEDYKENFMIADATFLHQIIYDPFQRKLTPLNPVLEYENIEYCKNSGEMFDNEAAYQLALGNLDPVTMNKVSNWNPDVSFVNEYSIWSRVYKPHHFKPERASTSKTFKSKLVDTKITDLTNTLHDQQIAKELEFYKGTPTEPVKISAEKDSNKSPKVEPKISPVLGNNPFVKTKISRFQVTETKSDLKVISRFFSNVVGRQVDKSEFNSSSSLNVPGDDSDSPKEGGELGINTPPGVGSGASSEDNSSLYTHAGDVCDPTDDDVEDLPMVEYHCASEEDKECDINQPGTWSGALASVENLPGTGVKRKANEDGKAHPKKKKQKQLKIQDMFTQMKMSEMP